MSSVYSTHTPFQAPARVIAIQQPVAQRGRKVDFTAAAKFGRLEVLVSNGRHILTPDVFRDTLNESLRTFNPERDYIIPIGDYAAIFLVGMLLGQRFKYVRILRWVPDVQEYQPLTLDLRQHTALIEP